MPYMRPEIYQGHAYVVETSHGTEIVPADLSPPTKKDLQQYLKGVYESHTLAKGWRARLSAPGYLDATEWTLHDTFQEAVRYLRDFYGEEEEETSTNAHD